METANIRSWAQIAEWWDARIGDDGDLWRQGLVDPALRAVIGEVAGLRALDLGCGNGYWCRRLARAGATVVGIDASQPIIELARRREAADPHGIAYHAANAARLPMLDDASFDLVISNLALMDIEDLAGAFREVGRVLRPGARFVASMFHPCFEVPGRSGWAREHFPPHRTIWRKVRGYRDRYRTTIHWRLPNGGMFHTETFHRPLSWIIRALRDAGMAVTLLEEPSPTPQFASDSQADAIAEIPLHLILEAIRLPSGGW